MSSHDARPRRVVIAVDYPPSDRDSHRFGLHVLSARGFDVEIWDLSKVFFSRVSSWDPELGGAGGHAVRRVGSIAEIADLASTLDSTSVLVFVGGLQYHQSPTAMTIASSVKRISGAHIGAVSVGTLPTVSNGASGLADLLHAVRTRGAGAVIRLATRRAISTAKVRLGMYAHVNAELVWVGVDTSGIAAGWIGPDSHVHAIHNLDYDTIIEQCALDPLEAEFVLFIDSLGPLHPDHALRLRASQMSVDDYRYVMGRALDGLERATGLPVVIAAHPRSAPNAIEALYGSRDVRYGQTPNLIRRASLVAMCEGSTVVGLAAHYERPMLFITSPLLEGYDQDLATAMAKWLNAPTVSVSDVAAGEWSGSVDRGAYRTYVENFLKRPGTVEAPFWQAVADDITNLRP